MSSDSEKNTPDERPVVLITGTSSGVGLELVKMLKDKPYRVVGTTLPQSIHLMQEEGIEEDEDLIIRTLDITHLQRQEEIVNEIEERWGGVDILVNNAGISYRASVEDMTVYDEERQMHTNYVAPFNLVRLVLPSMRKKRRGRIINISSVGGMMAMPTMSSYSASKWALEGASEALWYEMRPWNIKVTLVQPGFINSLAFTKVMSPQPGPIQMMKGDYKHYYSNMAKLVSFCMKHAPYTSKDVAKVIFKIMRRRYPPLRAYGTPDARLFYYFRQSFPKKIYRWFLCRMLPNMKHWAEK